MRLLQLAIPQLWILLNYELCDCANRNCWYSCYILCEKVAWTFLLTACLISRQNVKFLAKFITEAGIINKRSKVRNCNTTQRSCAVKWHVLVLSWWLCVEQTGISAKAQRKVAREIKTARAFGLMPFTTMGTKQFRYGDTMEDMDRDFEFESTYDHNFVEEGADAWSLPCCYHWSFFLGEQRLSQQPLLLAEMISCLRLQCCSFCMKLSYKNFKH